MIGKRDSGEAGKLVRRVKVAGKAERADLLLKNVRVVDLFNGECELTNIILIDGCIAGLGKIYDRAEEVIDLNGAFAVPGLIDAHLHIESTLLFPSELARTLIVRGTTAIINDPHEIANVFGIEGVRMMLNASEGLPCDFFTTAPSCVPATNMETAGGEITALEIEHLLNDDRVIALGEMMNYPGVVSAEPQVLQKIVAAQKAGKAVDGHAPGLSGEALQAYLTAGISTDHECVSAEEALEKLKLGMKIIIRHGSASSSLRELLPLVNQRNVGQFLFGSDDREAAELLSKGHLDQTLREAVALGLDPVMAIRMATLNAAIHYSLPWRGLIAPGYKGDIVIFDNLIDFNVQMVIKNGEKVVEKGRLSFEISEKKIPDFVLNSVKLPRQMKAEDFSGNSKLYQQPIIGVIPGQLITEKLEPLFVNGEEFKEKVKLPEGINRLAVVERHKGSGRIALALVRGIGLQEGAVASSVAHDSHNIIVAGVEETAMAAAVNALQLNGGGFVAVNRDGEIMSLLPLEVGGLMSLERAETVSARMEDLLKKASKLGTGLDQPFLTLSFLALPVIPSLKLTDRGLFDVDNFTFV